MIGDVYKTTIKVNGETVYASRFSTCYCPMIAPPPMISCFNFGFRSFHRPSFSSGLGMGLGFAAGMAFFPAMNLLCQGIGNLFSRQA